MRPKRLLMHKREIKKLYDLTKQQGYAIIPLSVYFSKGRAKLEIGLCKGKNTYDKKQTIKERDLDRSAERDIKNAKL